jgi:AraC-like DNA-binding protein
MVLSQTPVTPMRRFSTDMFAPRERLSAWRDFFGAAIFKLDIEPYRKDGFRAETRFYPLPGLGLMHGITAPARHGRRRHMVDNDDILVSIPTAGRALFRTYGREAVIDVGGATWVGGGEAGYQDTFSDLEFIALQVPKSALRGAVKDLDSSICRPIPAATPALRLLRRYVITLQECAVTPELQAMMAAHLRDLVTLTLGATRDAAEAAKSGGLRAARLQAVLSEIEGNFARPEFSTEYLARKLGLSPRYMQELLQEEGASFTERVLELRLQRARAMLADPRNNGRNVLEIALAAGFNDGSYFNRRFRARFGVPPSAFRGMDGAATH